jgi:hypothetical protein
MSEYPVIFTKTYDYDFCADFGCAGSDLPTQSCFEMVAIDEQSLASLRATVTAQADSLKAWADLWTHICTMTGCADYLPNANNFNAMIEFVNAKQADRIAALEQAVELSHIAMVKIGNALNWEAPVDQQLADAINTCRAARPASVIAEDANAQV